MCAMWGTTVSGKQCQTKDAREASSPSQKKKKQKKYLRRYNKNSTPLFSFPSVAGSLGGGGDVAVAILLVMNQLIYHHHRH